MEKDFLKLCKDNQFIGASCVIVKDGKIVEKFNYGKSNLKLNTDAKTTTVYRIASISKVVVASALMLLYEQGKIDFNEDISTYLGFKLRNPNYQDIPITLKHLMTHTSSITDGKEDEYDGTNTGYNAVNATNLGIRLQDLLLENGSHYVSETFDKNPPGSKYIYSNFNTGINTCIIEKVSNEYYPDFICSRIFQPLGLDASFVVTDLETKDIASLYSVIGDEVKPTREYDNLERLVYKKFPLGENYRGPAGGLHISMLDLSRFMNIFMNNGYPLLRKETVELMLSSHWQGKSNKYLSEQGLNIAIVDHFDNRILKGHFGSAYGARSFMLFNEDKKIGICYITNGGNYKLLPIKIDNVQEKLIQLFLDKYWN